VVGFVLALLGTGAATITLVLVAIEISFSFDNAIINAKILGTLSPFWQRMFLSVGVIIAVLGMRILFPIAIVATTADLSWSQVLTLALHHPEQYAAKLVGAHTAIAAFGGSFLLMLALDFFLDEDRKVLWLVRLERFLQRVSRAWLPLVVAAAALCIVAALPANHQPKKTLVAGLAGLTTYVLVQIVTKLFGATQHGQAHGPRTGIAAFVTFLYLEILDASFSFDGVLGAFAVTTKVVLIAAGLGVGALWVRSLSVFMVRRGTLQAYRYLEHGAHYTILILACLLLTSVVVNVPDVIAGLAGVGCIVASIIASRQALAATK
jgi:hypothetical protein